MTYSELLDIAHGCAGKTFETVRGSRFGVRVVNDVPVFTPESTGISRSDGRLAAERFVERFSETGSTRPKDYQDVTRNASYFVALMLSQTA
jgi:hypothetical protein